MSTTTTAPKAATETARNPLIAIIFLRLVGGLQLVDPAVANTAIVEAGKDLGMTGSALALAGSISTLALAATVLPFGVMADRLGRRKILMLALALTVVGDVIVAITPVSAGYLAGRALAGIGVGAALAATFAYVRFVSAPGKLASALGMWNLAMVGIFIAGALVGGELADSSWRLAMLLVPVLAGIFLLLTPVFLKPMPKTAGGGIDYPGMIVIALGMIGFLYGVSQAGKGLKSPEFLIPTIAGLVLFGVYYVVEKRSPHPIFPASLFLKGAFAAAVVAGIGWNFAQAVVQLQTSNFWQLVQGFSTGEVALAQVVFMVSFGAGGVFVGKLIRPGNRMMWLIGAGFVGMAVSFVLLALVSPSTHYWYMAVVLFLFGLGLALVAVPQSTIFVSSAPPGYLGPVTSFRTTAGQLGYALGFAASAGILNAFSNMELVNRLRDAGLPDSQLGGAVDQVML